MNDLHILLSLGICFFLLGVSIWAFNSQKQIERQRDEIRRRLREAIERNDKN